MHLPRSGFTENLMKLNAIRLAKWVFEPGMLFMSENKWWADKGLRAHRHSGLDLLLYEREDGVIESLVNGTQIPALYPGTIVGYIKDFLGHSVFVSHEIREKGSQLFTIYGHVTLLEDICIGKTLKEGSVVASLEGTVNSKVPGHLHLSVVLIPDTIPLEILSWDLLEKTDNVMFFDPREII